MTAPDWSRLTHEEQRDLVRTSCKQHRENVDALMSSNRGRSDYRVALDPASIDPLMDSLTVVIAQVESESIEKLARTTAPMTRGQRLALSWFYYETHVIYGSSECFWESGYAGAWIIMVEALEEFGALDHARALRDSAGVLGAAPPIDRKLRWRRHEKLTDDDLDTWTEIDTRIRELNEQAPLRSQIEQYVADHPDEFFF